MKKYISLVLMGILMLGAVTVYAEGGTTIKEDMKAKIEAMRAERETFRQSMMAQKEEFRKNIEQRRAEFRGHAQTMLAKRFDVAIRNFELIQTRIQARIDKAEADGKDTTVAKTAMTTFKTKLDAAKVKIAEVKALLPDTDEKITADTFEQVKLGAHDAKELLKEARAALVEAIKSLKQ